MVDPVAPLLQIEHLSVQFRIRQGLFGRGSYTVKAVNNVSFEISPGETFGLVGESGSGKSTIGRALLRLVESQAGSIFLAGKELDEKTTDLLDFRRDLQVVFQDPYSSLNPSMNVADIVGEPLTVHYGIRGVQRDNKVRQLLEQVGLRADQIERYPSEFSGGQRQRIAIARALALEPRIIICDEAVSSLDVSTQSQVIGLLEELQQRIGLAFLFIAHDLAVVRHISHRIGVLYLGQLLEVGPSDRVYEAPAHPYTRLLLDAVPIADPVEQKRRKAQRRNNPVAELPSPADLPKGCPYQGRCPYVTDICRREFPQKRVVPEGGWVACHWWEPGRHP